MVWPVGFGRDSVGFGWVECCRLDLNSGARRDGEMLSEINQKRGTKTNKENVGGTADQEQRPYVRFIGETVWTERTAIIFRARSRSGEEKQEHEM